MVAPFSTSTCVFGRLKFTRLVRLKFSQRNCSALVSEKRKRRDRLALRLAVPGPSMMLRPELPKRNEPTGTTGNAERSNHWSGVGFDSLPEPTRSGREAPPWVRLKFATLGAKGGPV